MSTSLVAAILSAGAVAVVVTSAWAGNVPRLGDQHVGLAACAFVGTCPDITLTADAPFHVAHGFAAEPWSDLVNPIHRFELAVDSVQVHGAVDLDRLAGYVGDKWYVFNFPEGMTGTHTFTGCWYATDGGLIFCGTRVVHFD